MIMISNKNNKNDLRYEIGGVCLSFNVEHAGIKKFIESNYKDYTSYRKPDIYIDIEHKDKLAKPRFESLIFQTKAWKLGTPYHSLRSDTGQAGNDGAIFYLPYKKNSCVARLNKSLDSIKFHTEDCSGWFFLSSFAEILYSLILPQKKALMLHGSGVLNSSKGYLFLAKSGGGKSTIAKLALKKGFKVLNDDRIIIRKEKNLFNIYGNPWHGKVQQTANISQNISEVFFLRKAKVNDIKAMRRSEAVLEFLNNNHCIPVNNEVIKERFNICSDLAENLKCYWLDFKPDESIWRFLDGLAE